MFSWINENGSDDSGAGKLGGVGKHSCVKRRGWRWGILRIGVVGDEEGVVDTLGFLAEKSRGWFSSGGVRKLGWGNLTVGVVLVGVSEDRRCSILTKVFTDCYVELNWTFPIIRVCPELKWPNGLSYHSDTIAHKTTKYEYFFKLSFRWQSKL